MVAINVVLTGPTTGDTRSDRLTWQEEVAPGETLGRLLARLAVEHELVGRLYDASDRVLRLRASATINGRAYNLLGGLTYTLHEGDTISLGLGQISDSG